MEYAKKIYRTLKAGYWGYFTSVALSFTAIVDGVQTRLWEIIQFYFHKQPSTGEMTALLNRMGVQSFKQYIVGQKKNYFGARNFIPVDKNTFTNRIENEFSDAKNEIIQTADKIISGEFNILGSGFVDMRRRKYGKGFQLDWQKDPISSLRYKRIFSHWRFNVFKMRPGDADIKGPWELTRCQYFVTLGQAYWLTGNEKYARYFVGWINDFISKNPPGFGIHWACNMDVSLRLVGWLTGLVYFQSSKHLTYFWWKRFLKSLVEHGRFIASNLEYGTFHGKLIFSNHGVANFFGLYWLSMNFPHLDAACVWRGIAETGLEREVLRQIRVDGGPFESSIAYHRLVVEMFLSTFALAEHTKLPLSSIYKDRLSLGLKFIHTLRQGSGRLAQIGDADNGRGHIFSQYSNWQPDSMDHLLVAGAHILDQPQLLTNIPKNAFIEALSWTTVNSLKPTQINSCSRVEIFPATGVSTLNVGESHVTFANLNEGTDGVGNHKHCDQLSFEWCLGSQPIIVDGGSYTYTQDPEARNQHRATSIHNTVMFGKQEQHEFKADQLFNLRQRGCASFVRQHQNDLGVGVHGKFTGYERLQSSIVHERRCLLLSDNVLIVEDFIFGANITSRWNLLLYPNIKVTMLNQDVILKANQVDVNIKTNSLIWHAIPSWYSPGYGIRQATSALVCELDEVVPRVILLFQPVKKKLMSIEQANQLADIFWAE